MLDSRSGSWIVALALALPLACSDDGVPQDENGSANTGSTETSVTDTNPSTDDPTTTSPTGTMTSSTTDPTTDPTTDSATSTDPTDPPNDTSGTDSSSTTEGTGTDTSGTDTSGSSDESSSDGSSSDTNGGLPTGSDCNEDSDCASGVCWDFADYDPFCGGTACSVECVSDDECFEAFDAANAPNPEESFCGEDGRCWVQGTGFGAFFCQMESSASVVRQSQP